VAHRREGFFDGAWGFEMGLARGGEKGETESNSAKKTQRKRGKRKRCKQGGGPGNSSRKKENMNVDNITKRGSKQGQPERGVATPGKTKGNPPLRGKFGFKRLEELFCLGVNPHATLWKRIRILKRKKKTKGKKESK